MFDKNYILDFTKKIMQIDSPTGYTKEAIVCLDDEAKKLGYKTNTDHKGNLHIYINGQDSSKTVGVSAHTDTLGLMVRTIHEDGSLNVTSLGGPILNTYDGEYCRIVTREQKVFTGTILSKSPAAHVYADAKTRPRLDEEMFVRIDEKVHSKKEVEALGIQNGDFVCIDTKFEVTSTDFIKSRYLDDKMCIGILYGILKYFKDHQITPTYNLIFMIPTYEEVGFGASYIPSEISEMIALDMGCIGLDLSGSEYAVSICAKDKAGPYDYELTSKLINLAKKEKLTYAVDIYPYYSSDVSAALRGGNDIRGALIGPGIHASHGMERTNYQAVEQTLKLLYAYLLEK